MTISNDKVLISLVITKHQHEILKAMAERDDSTISSLIRKGIKFVINKHYSLESINKENEKGDYLMEVLDRISLYEEE